MTIRDLDLLRGIAVHAFRRKDRRSHYVGALGLRADGAFVRAYNSPAPLREPSIHAEARLCRKLDVGASVWVARMNRLGELALAKPCPNCHRALQFRGVRRVVYSIDPYTYGVMDFG